MIEHIWSVLCSDAIVDERTNNVSMWKVVEQITVSGEPKPDAVIPVSFSIVTFCIRSETNEPAEGNLRFSIESPSGNVRNFAEVKINLTIHERYRHITNIRGMAADEDGRYYFQIDLKNEEDWIRVANIPLIVRFQPSETEKGHQEEELELET